MLSERVYPTIFGFNLSTVIACIARERQPLSKRGLALNRQAEGVACRPSSLWLFSGDQLFFVFYLAVDIFGWVRFAQQNRARKRGRAPGQVVPNGI